MKELRLTSCTCGVVLDKNMLNFPKIYNTEGKIIKENAIFDGDQYISAVYCPVCGAMIPYNS